MDDVLSKEWRDDVIRLKNTPIERVHHVFLKTSFTFFADQLISGIICLFCCYLSDSVKFWARTMYEELSDGEGLVFQRVEENEGGAFSRAEGRFTAPARHGHLLLPRQPDKGL